MDDDDDVDSNHSDYKTHCAGNDLDVDRCLCLNDVNEGDNFAGDNDNFDRLSRDILTIIDWKKSNNNMSINVNDASKEIDRQLRTDVKNTVQNAKKTCDKQIKILNNLVELRHERDLLILKALLSSDVKLLQNNCNKCTNFIRAFLICPLSGLALKDLLETTSADRDMHNPSIISKLMTHKECIKI